MDRNSYEKSLPDEARVPTNDQTRNFGDVPRIGPHFAYERKDKRRCSIVLVKLTVFEAERHPFRLIVIAGPPERYPQMGHVPHAPKYPVETDYEARQRGYGGYEGTQNEGNVIENKFVDLFRKSERKELSQFVEARQGPECDENSQNNENDPVQESMVR